MGPAEGFHLGFRCVRSFGRTLVLPVPHRQGSDKYSIILCMNYYLLSISIEYCIVSQNT
jgi:hypothetical protein